MARQVLVIHGGSTYETQEQYLAELKAMELNLDRIRPSIDWKLGLQADLGNGFDVLAPRMPNGSNAQYEEWRIMFEKLLPYLTPDFILIGHSLGGIFLAKRLAEHGLPQLPAATILVAAPFDDETPEDPLASFRLPADISKIQERAGKLYLFQSDDDPVVPFGEMAKYKAVLPSAITIALHGYQHVNQRDFPELVELIKSL